MHLKFILIDFNLVQGDNVCDRLGHILKSYFITLISFRTYFQELGDAIFVMLSIFLSMSLTTLRITQTPKYFISVFQRNNFQYHI